MIERLTSGWTFTRVLYLVMGAFIMVQSAMDKMWAGVAFGAYFAAMGLFAFGCASGNCYSYRQPTKATSEMLDSEIQYEEVK